jgi:micrococcal nuclease
MSYMSSMRLIFFLLVLTACLNQNGKTSEETYPGYDNSIYNLNSQTRYKVIRIKDGDTFVLLVDKKELVVRLEHIDCPEKKQPFGNKAKQFAADLCFGQYVTLQHKDQYDRNKRLIAEVLLADGRNVNKELVKNGFAWHFKRYSDDAVYAQLETNARNEHTGIWSDKNPIAPWNWRKK